MNFNLLIIVTIGLFILFFYNSNEHFTDLDYKKISDYKTDTYINFLTNVNNNFTHNKKKENNILSEEFLKVPLVKIKSEIFSNKTIGNEVNFKNSNKDDCLYKAITLSEVTNPMLYLNSRSYPSRHLLKTFKNIPLPKNTNLKRFNDMLNCCKGKF